MPAAIAIARAIAAFVAICGFRVSARPAWDFTQGIVFMDDETCVFNDLRPRLQKIAYRMLGSVAEAEDVVQDVWLRWFAADRGAIENGEAWLVAVATRLSIDRLRAAKVQREYYTGIWLPEPEMTDSPTTPEQAKERADEVSVAFLLLLERLTPEARAAFLLREVFDADYSEVALAIGKSEAACRQLVSRAKRNSATSDHAILSRAKRTGGCWRVSHRQFNAVTSMQSTRFSPGRHPDCRWRWQGNKFSGADGGRQAHCAALLCDAFALS